MASWIGQIHDATKWLLPAEHYGLDLAQKSSTDLVKGGSKALGSDLWYNRADRDSKDFGTWGENNLAGIGSVLGGMYALGEGAGSSAAGSVGDAGPAVGNGGFLGEGVSSGITGWDGAAGGAGLGFDSGGLPASASAGNLDIPGGSSGNSMNGLSSLLRGQGGQQQQGYSGGRQNLPLMQNEKTDQQKLAELLQALQKQQGGY